jgi:hypothetical protein
MARKSLRPELNRIRAWVRQGRTEAWIAHQLEVNTSQLQDFIKRNGLSPGDEDVPAGEVDLRDEIEAEIEAAEEEEAKQEETKGRGRDKAKDDEEKEKDDEDGDGEGKPRRRRRRRGGRGRRRRRPGAGMSATFEHGEKDGYGLWLDASIKDDPIYKEQWAEVTELRVTVEPNRIVLERPLEEPAKDEKDEKDEPEKSSDDDGGDDEE